MILQDLLLQLRLQDLQDLQDLQCLLLRLRLQGLLLRLRLQGLLHLFDPVSS
jgi:hypothetical protein